MSPTYPLGYFQLLLHDDAALKKFTVLVYSVIWNCLMHDLVDWHTHHSYYKELLCRHIYHVHLITLEVPLGVIVIAKNENKGDETVIIIN